VDDGRGAIGGGGVLDCNGQCFLMGKFQEESAPLLPTKLHWLNKTSSLALTVYPTNKPSAGLRSPPTLGK
jgi:hypothetical protein